MQTVPCSERGSLQTYGPAPGCERFGGCTLAGTRFPKGRIQSPAVVQPLPVLGSKSKPSVVVAWRAWSFSEPDGFSLCFWSPSDVTESSAEAPLLSAGGGSSS